MKKIKAIDRKITTLDMEVALSIHFKYWANLVVPNVSWGMGKGLHECDLLIMNGNNYMYEVEIKISKADLIKDKKKAHGHFSHYIKYLFFAIPEYLSNCIEHIPERAGIIVVRNRTEKDYNYWLDNGIAPNFCNEIRRPKQNSKYRFLDSERYTLAKLGAVRTWGLKKKLQAKIKKLNEQTRR